MTDKLDLKQSQPSSPVTRVSLCDDLRSLGVEPGVALLVHSSLRQIGWTVGGAESVVQVLMDVLTPEGTLVMPTFSGQLSDPAVWQSPPAPPDWIEAIRTHMPPFDPARTPTRDMGRIVEAFRTWPGVRRSTHPVQSCAAWGRHAEYLVESHPLDWPLGDRSPLGRHYDLDGQVLLIGVGYDRNSSLHLAETRAKYRRQITRSVPVGRKDGSVDWIEIKDVDDDLGRLFPELGASFDETGHVRFGMLGGADCRLMSQRALADFAVSWFDAALAPAQ